MMTAIVDALNKTISDGVKSCVDSRMATAIELWTALYEDRAPWLSQKKGIESAGIPSAMSAELSRLVTLEMKTEADDEGVNQVYQRAIEKIRIPVEYGCALGGVVIKPYTGPDDEIAIQYIRADRFFPLAFDSSGKISHCVFVDQFKQGRDIYTRLEVHQIRNGLHVNNIAFKSSTSGKLGARVPLDSVPQWADLAEEASFQETDRLPIGYFKVPLANTIDPDSPLGVSVFSRAVTLIKEADRRYSNEVWELEAKQAAIHIAGSLLKLNKDTGAQEYPEGRERLYRVVQYNTGAADKPLLEEFSPDIRSDALSSTYQAQLRRIEFACGLAYGTISDPDVVDKTATEVRYSKQRLYATVTDIQKALEDALEDLVAAIAFWMHRPVPKTSFLWDDSIIVDSQSLQAQKLLEFQAGIIDKVKYHMDVYGLSEEAAIQTVADIKARAPERPMISFREEGV